MAQLLRASGHRLRGAESHGFELRPLYGTFCRIRLPLRYQFNLLSYLLVLRTGPWPMGYSVLIDSFKNVSGKRRIVKTC